MVFSAEPSPAPLLFDPNLPCAHYNGQLVGEGLMVCSTPDLYQVKGFLPPKEFLKYPERLLLSVNGMGCELMQAVEETKEKAKIEGCTSICLYDATSGDMVSDVIQAINHKFNAGESKTVLTLKTIIHDAIKSGKELFLSGDSRGAAVIGRALCDVEMELLKSGKSKEAVEKAFSNFRVTTTGGAAWCFPDGPKYVHYICKQDLIAFYFGLTTFNMSPEEIAKLEKTLPNAPWRKDYLENSTMKYLLRCMTRKAGRDATIILFDSAKPDDWFFSHNTYNYFAQMKPFDDVYVIKKPSK
jgi:hypothetical protein